LARAQAFISSCRLKNGGYDGKKILIVDDEPDILDLATIRLKKTGYEIIEAPNAEEAIDIIGRPALI